MLKRKILISLILFTLIFVSLPFLFSSGREEVLSSNIFSLGLKRTQNLEDFPKVDIGAIRDEIRKVGLLSLPAVVDHSDGIPPVGNQGSQGSCASWASVYYYKSYQEGVERGWGLTSTDHQFSPAYVYNQIVNGNCDRGSTFPENFNILVTQGADPLSVFPYNQYDCSTQPTDEQKSIAYPYRAESYGRLDVSDIDALKTYLASGDIFVVAIPVYTDFYYVPDDPDYVYDYKWGTYQGGHGMAVVGYNDSLQAFKVVNSWGTSWGYDGFVNISYNFFRTRAWEAWAMTDHVESTSPPSPPQNLLASSGNGFVDLSWEPPQDSGTPPFTEYRIYRGLSSGSEEFLVSVSSDTTSYHDTGVTNGNTYWYYVTAVNSSGESDPSNEVSATPEINYGTMSVLPASWSTTINYGESDSEVFTVSASDGDILNVTVEKISGPDWITVSPENLGDISSGQNKTFSITAFPPAGVTGEFNYVVRVSCAHGTPSYIDITGTIVVEEPPPPPQPPPPPVLISPENGSSVSWTPTLIWEASQGATSYNIQILSRIRRRLRVVYSATEITSTQYTVPEGILSLNTLYYWRVCGVNSYGQSDWSSMWSFTVTSLGPQPPPPPTLISPENGSIVRTLTPTFEWEEISDADLYELSIEDSSHTEIYNNNSIITTSFTLPEGILSDGSVYYWRVKAHNSDGWGDYSDQWSFTVSLPTPPSSPQNLTGVRDGESVVLSWDPPENDGGSSITGYRIYKGTSSGEETFLIEVSSTTTSYTDTDVSGGNTYWYYVTAVNSVGESNPSNEVSVYIPLNPPPPPTLISPENGSILDTLTPTFIWEEADRATSYNLQILTRIRRRIRVVYSVNGILDTQFTIPDGILEEGVMYWWRVAGVNDAGVSSWSQMWSFTIAVNTLSENNVILVSDAYTSCFNSAIINYRRFMFFL